MHLVVPRRHPPSVGQPLLHALELFAIDDGRHGRHGDPLGRVVHAAALPTTADGPQGGAPPLDGSRAQAIAEHLAGVDGIGQQPAHGREVPAAEARRRDDPQASQTPRQLADRSPLIEPGEQVTRNRRLGLVQANPGGIARSLGVDPVAVGRPGPGQQDAGPQLAQTAAAHALGDQRPLVFGDGAADLQQQLVVRVLAHRPVEKRDHGAVFLQFLDQEHLVHVVARQPVRRGDQDAVQPGARGGVAQAVQARTPETGAAVASVAKDLVLRQGPALRCGMRVQAVDLLVNGLRPSLASARNPDVAGYLHDGSPPRGPTERAEEPAGRRARRRPAEAPDRPCPTAVVPLDGRPAAGARSTAAASWPAPRGQDPLGTAAPAPGSARSDPDRARRCARTNRPRRIRQNLSFANRPSWRCRGRSC